MKVKTVYTCEHCGSQSPKWVGQCPDCGAWNSLSESVAPSRAAAAPRQTGYAGEAPRVVPLKDFDTTEERRRPTGIGELDRVIGGGLVAGSVVLIGGDPGIGKSTLLLQMMGSLTASGLRGLYVTGEESGAQIALRARRLGVSTEGLLLLMETNVERILALALEAGPEVMVVDSIQTIYSDKLSSAPGGVSQIRESAAELVRFAKQRGVSVYLVGHVTKEGALAGPRVLEHMVDTVLYFEGESASRFRIVRAVKNRFGAVNELGVFAMTDRGLKEVTSPSAIFLSRHALDTPGSAVMVTREGTRPLLVEVQALVDAARGGNPRRLTVGLDPNRLAMLLAVLNRHARILIHDHDVFVNAVGGVRILETGADLAVVLAVVSSLSNCALPRDLVVFGEVGLAGEIRPVVGGPERLKEAAQHGFKRAICPQGNAPKGGKGGIKVTEVTTVAEALAALSGASGPPELELA
jgi:DNA repair protein RadA/Sms